MTQPPGGYPPPEPGDPHPPPADPFYAPPSWDPPSASPGSPYQPPGATVPMPAVPGPPAGSPYGPPGGPPPGPPGASPYPPLGPPPPRRRGLLIGLIALVAVLMLSAAGGVTAWLLIRDPDRNGAASPTAAVDSFLQAVYHDQDAERAADLVCSEARDQAALQTKIDELKAYQGTQVSPTFAWTDPAVIEQRDELAVVEVTVTMTTGDEKTADQSLHVSVLDKQDDGWWVCDLAAVDSSATPSPGDGSGTPAPSESPSGSGG